MECLLEDALSISICKGEKELCLGTERSWAVLQTQQEPQPIPQGALKLWLPQIAARGLSVYRPPLTTHWIQAVPWTGCFFSAKNSTWGAILDVGIVLSSELSAVNPLSSWRIWVIHHTTISSHEKICERPPKRIKIHYTHFAHLKCWLILPNFSPKSLNHLYFYQQRRKTPISQPLSQLWKLKCDGGKCISLF